MKVTKAKGPELNFNLAKRLSGKELTTFEHRAHRPSTEPKLRRWRGLIFFVRGVVREQRTREPRI
jgi:hypothetical protein